MCLHDQCYSHDNHYWTCGQTTELTRQKYADQTSCETSATCSNPSACRRDIHNVCDPADGGWCRYGECAMSDELGCYTLFTEMGHLFEYELWGCTEYEVLSLKFSKIFWLCFPKTNEFFPFFGRFFREWDTRSNVICEAALSTRCCPCSFTKKKLCFPIFFKCVFPIFLGIFPCCFNVIFPVFIVLFSKR